MEKIIVRRKVEKNLSSLSHLHPVLQRIYAARSVTSPDELNRELVGLLPFTDLLDINKAVMRLAQAIKYKEHILIIGDFDADGATSTTLAVSALKLMGAQQVSYLVPNRFTFGYGLTPEIVSVAADRNPKLIITVDNGIASFAGVSRANELGIDVIITDHHLPSETLPSASAIVNPNQKGDPFLSKCMAGVAVIFYVMIALRRWLQDDHWFERQNISCPNMAQFLDLVALGTVADLVPLDSNNRIMVHQGLYRIQSGRTRPGILALLEVAGKSYEKTTTTELGFIIGPRLNAAGRLDDMSLGIACLLAQNYTEAKNMAQQLNQLNQERRAIELQMQQEAFSIVERMNLTKQLPKGLCLYDEDWHQGVVGLVASRVKEKINRPVIAFAKADDTVLKGSARSIQGLHIRDVLDNIAMEHPHLLSKFGGHAMAAGLSISAKSLPAFKEAFAVEVARHVSDDDLLGRIETDGELQPEDFSLDTAELLRNAGPWGQGFPEPIFDGVFNMVDQYIVGQRHLKLLLQVPGSNVYLDGIAFNIDLSRWPNNHCKSVQLAYRLDINEYQGRRKLQLVIEEIMKKDV